MSSDRKPLYVNFNQDYSCLAAGTTEGFKIYTVEPFRKCYEKQEGGMCIVAMLYSTSLLALVGAGQQASLSPRRLQLYNSSEAKVICELNFVSNIINVYLSKKRLIVILEQKIHIFDVSTMKILRTIDNVNPKGLCALSMNPEQSYIAYPYGSEMGDILLCDVMNPHPINVIRAHKGSVSALAFNSDGTMLATASSKGTVIRIFAIPSTKLLYTLRRGSSSANIYSISFSADSSMVCVSSDKGTVHIFKLPEDQSRNRQNVNVGSISDTISNMWDSVRDFAHLKMKDAGQSINVCGMTASGNTVVVATMDGWFFRYSFDPINGGECRLEEEHNILSDSPASSLAATAATVSSFAAAAPPAASNSNSNSNTAVSPPNSAPANNNNSSNNNTTAS